MARGFIRLDDVGLTNQNIETFIARILEAGHSLNVEVIPTDLTPRTALFLNEIGRRYPNQLEAHLHGFKHVNYEAGLEKSEFGSRRCLQAKRADIIEGWKLLLDTIRPILRPFFCPPWDNMDSETAKVLTELNFLGVSANKHLKADIYGLHNFAYDLNWNKATGLHFNSSPGATHYSISTWEDCSSFAINSEDNQSVIQECLGLIDKGHGLAINVHILRPHQNQSFTILSNLIYTLAAVGCKTDTFSQLLARKIGNEPRM